MQGRLLQPYTYYSGAIEDQDRSWSDEWCWEERVEGERFKTLRPMICVLACKSAECNQLCPVWNMIHIAHEQNMKTMFTAVTAAQVTIWNAETLRRWKFDCLLIWPSILSKSVFSFSCARVTLVSLGSVSTSLSSLGSSVWWGCSTLFLALLSSRHEQHVQGVFSLATKIVSIESIIRGLGGLIT